MQIGAVVVEILKKDQRNSAILAISAPTFGNLCEQNYDKPDINLKIWSAAISLSNFVWIHQVLSTD